MEKERKYNIGDKVVCISKEYYDNPFYKDKFIKSTTVTDVSFRGKHPVFYIYEKRRMDSIGDPCDWQPYEFYDADGKRTDQPRVDRWLHAEKDKDEIQRLIAEAKSEFADKCQESREKSIAAAKRKIELLQKEIARYEEGDAYPGLGSYRLESKWNSDMNELIKKHL